MPRNENTEEPAKPAGAGRAVAALLAKLAVALVALVALLWVGRQLGFHVPRFALWVDSLGVWGPLVFVAGYSIATVAFIPGSLLTLAAGAIFGLAKGTLFTFFGASFGAAGAFLVARYVARGWVEGKIESNPRFHSIDQAVGGQGLKIVTLLRLSPVFPFNLLNYALGLTQVRFRDYLIACLGMLPGTFLYVYYGKALGSLAALAGGAEVQRDSGYWVVLALGLVATLAVTIVVTRIARRALQQEVSDA